MMKKEFWIIFFIFYDINNISSSVIPLEGSDVGLTDFPWLALLMNRQEDELKVACAGIVISEKHILTAAHCVTGRALSYATLESVRLGEYDLKSDIDCVSGNCAPTPVDMKVEEIKVNPRWNATNYTKNNFYGDIALIKLKEKIKFSDYIQPITLAPKNILGNSLQLKSGDDVTVVGYERSYGESQTQTKRKLDMTIFDHEECKKQYGSQGVIIDESQICAGGKYNREDCIGPSGAPLMRLQDDKWILVGVISFSRGCGLKDWPEVNSDVSYYSDWIQDNIKD